METYHLQREDQLRIEQEREGGREGEICGGVGTVTMLLHHTSKWVCLRLAHGNTEDMENN